MLLLILLQSTTVLIVLSEEIAPRINNSESLDYRKQGLVGKVRNQGSCDAGWAFAIIGLIEGQYAKKNGKLVDLSAQELIDCLYECGGCRYSDAATAMDSLTDLGGIEQDDDYPFVGKKQRCHYKPAISKVRVTDYSIHELRSEKQLKQLLEKNGPLYVAIDSDSLKGYRHGILTNCLCNQINHAVLLIGYGTENGEDYWLIKNSYGTAWGDRGYGKIRRGVNACGLMDMGAVTAEIDDELNNIINETFF